MFEERAASAREMRNKLDRLGYDNGELIGLFRYETCESRKVRLKVDQINEVQFNTDSNFNTNIVNDMLMEMC